MFYGIINENDRPITAPCGSVRLAIDDDIFYISDDSDESKWYKIKYICSLNTPQDCLDWLQQQKGNKQCLNDEYSQKKRLTNCKLVIE